MKKLLLLALCAILPVFAQASFFATGGEETIIDNGATAVHSFTNNGMFTLSQDRSVRILLVGGGGGGGAECGGGGGGGGAVYRIGVPLAAGTYAVSVGRGGDSNGAGGGGSGFGYQGTARGGYGGCGTVIVAYDLPSPGTIILVK